MVCFVENLTLRVWFGHVLPWVIRRRRSGMPVRSCRVVEASPIAWAITRFMAVWLNIKMEIFTFRLAEIRDENNLLVRMRIPYQDVPAIRDRIVSDARFQEFLSQTEAAGRLPFFIAKQVTDVQIVFEGTMGRLVFLIQVCRWAAKESGKDTAVLFVDERTWGNILHAYAAAWGIDLRTARRLNLSQVARAMASRLPPLLITLLNIIRFRRKDIKSAPYVIGLARRLFHDGRKHPAISEGPKIGVHYTGQLHLENPERYSDLFFLHNSSIPASDVTVLFGLPSAPLTPAKRDDLKRRGIRSVAQRPEMTTVFDVPVYNFGASAPKVGKSGDSEQTALEQARADYNALRAGWNRFFEQENIKVYVSWLKQNQVHAAMGDAIKAAGGILAIYQRSFEPLPTHELVTDTDVVFNFSPMSAEVERKGGSRIRYHVATGYLGDFRFPLLRQRAQEVRGRLLATGVKRILAFFDENSGPDPRWHTGHDLQREGYAFILEKVINNPDVALLIKPKVPSTLRARLGPVAETLKAAEKTGRCLVLGEGELHSALPPAAAGLASDMAIHNCLAAATAGVEVALAGVPTVLMDREGWGVSPLHALGRGKVAFTEWEDLWSAITNHWKRPEPGFGEWGSYLNQVDPFRDGHAAERMASYLDWLLDAFRNGRDREAAMALASERYAARWGIDKIVEVRDGEILPLAQRTHVALA